MCPLPLEVEELAVGFCVPDVETSLADTVVGISSERGVLDFLWGAVLDLDCLRSLEAFREAESLVDEVDGTKGDVEAVSEAARLPNPFARLVGSSEVPPGSDGCLRLLVWLK